MDMAVPHLHHEDSSPVPILQVTRHLRCHGRRDQSDPLPNTHSRLGHFPGPWREGFDNTPPSSNNTAALSTSSGSTKQRQHQAVAAPSSGSTIGQWPADAVVRTGETMYPGPGSGAVLVWRVDGPTFITTSSRLKPPAEYSTPPDPTYPTPPASGLRRWFSIHSRTGTALPVLGFWHTPSKHTAPVSDRLANEGTNCRPAKMHAQKRWGAATASA